METFQGIIRLIWTFECARLNGGTLMQKITLERHASTGKIEERIICGLRVFELHFV
jgi:hypothetical protein